MQGNSLYSEEGLKANIDIYIYTYIHKIFVPVQNIARLWVSSSCGAALATMVKLDGGRITITPDMV